MTNNSPTPARIASAMTSISSFRDERGCALDLHHFDAIARRHHVVLVEGTGTPDLAADLHAATVTVDLLEHHRAGPDQCCCAGPDAWRDVQMPARDRA